MQRIFVLKDKLFCTMKKCMETRNSMVYEMGQTIDNSALLNNYQSTVNFYQSIKKFQTFTAKVKSTTKLNLSGHAP